MRYEFNRPIDESLLLRILRTYAPSYFEFQDLTFITSASDEVLSEIYFYSGNLKYRVVLSCFFDTLHISLFEDLETGRALAFHLSVPVECGICREILKEVPYVEG